MNIANSPEVQAAISLVAARLENERKARNIPGISAGIVIDQELVWHQGYGVANVTNQTPANEKTVYRVASITKLFTATMLMQLRDAGKLNLDDPIDKYLPELKLNSKFPDAKPPTFKQIVSHASGLSREGEHEGWISGTMPGLEDLFRMANEIEMRLPAWTEPKYSNLAIALLGHALSRIAEQPYAEYIHEHILEPLGMANSSFNRSRYGEDTYGVGYQLDENDAYKEAMYWATEGHIGAGALFSNVEDIARFISLQFREGGAGGAQILGSTTLREMHMPVSVTPDFESGYGIGWGIRRVGGFKVVGHSGGLPGFTTNITLVPPLKLAAIAFTNYETAPALITQGMLETLIPAVQGEIERQEVKADRATRDQWTAYLGEYRGDSYDDHVYIEIVDKRLTLFEIGANPSTFTQLEPTSFGQHIFKLVGGYVSGDYATFQVDEAGRVTGLRLGAYPLWKTR